MEGVIDLLDNFEKPVRWTIRGDGAGLADRGAGQGGILYCWVGGRIWLVQNTPVGLWDPTRVKEVKAAPGILVLTL